WDRRVEHGSKRRPRLGAACDPDSENAAPRAETALCVRGYSADGLCLEGPRREARTFTWRPGDGSAETRVARSVYLTAAVARARKKRWPMHQSQRLDQGPSALCEKLQRKGAFRRGRRHDAQSPAVAEASG